MSTQPGQPRGLNLRGAVDLSGLKRPAGGPGRAAGAAGPGGVPGAAGAGEPIPVASLVVDVNAASFEAVLQLSSVVPVVLFLHSTASPDSAQLGNDLVGQVTADDGRWLLARIDIGTEREIASMLRVQSVPTVLAVIGGRPVPLFAGPIDAAQLRQVLDELLIVAEQNGINGRLQARDGGPAAEADAEPELPPLHAQAFDAIEAGDLDGAATAYQQALKENPADQAATAGLAQVSLLQRVTGQELVAAREAAAQNPDDLDAQLLVADFDVAGGHVEDGFARLIDLVRVSAGDDRDRVRQRLLDLFEVVGGTDERVLKARRALASALF